MGEALNTLQQRVENKFWEATIPWLEELKKIPEPRN